MKHLPTLLATAILALSPSALPAAVGDDTRDPFVKNAPEAPAAKEASWLQCVVTYETYALDRNEAVALLDAERSGPARYRKVLELAKAGKARQEILESLTTKSGQRALIESIDEVRYPTEFSPPESAKGLAMPTAWETRNVGDTFELEPVIGPGGRHCDINFVPQRVSLAEFRDEPQMAGSLLVSQPIFDTQKITTSTMVFDGEPHYLGTMTPTSPKGIAKGGEASEVWLAFLHTSIQGPPPAKPLPKPKTPSKGPAEEVWWPVELQYTCYSMDRATAREILTAPVPMNAPWEKVKALVAEKKAVLEHISTIKTKSGQRAVVEEIREVRFATEFTTEHHVGSTETTRRTVTNQVGEKKPDSKADKSDSTSTSTETITTNRTDANSELLPGYATAFETRNAGVTVEVEPVVGADGMTVDLNQVVQSVKPIGNLKVTGVATHYPSQLLFETAKVTNSMSVPLDLPVLVCTLNPPGTDGVNDRTDSGRTYLLFVRAALDVR